MVAIATVAILILGACSQKKEIISKDSFMLDTIINIKCYDYDNKEVINNAFDKINELENILSVHKENSDLYNIKNNAGKSFTEVSHHTMNIIKKSLYYYDLTEGYYDITLGPLIELWEECRETEELPDKEKVEYLLNFVDSSKLKLDLDNNTVYVHEGMYIDLGASAKGYIADEIKNYMIKNGVKSSIINLGGNINIIGSKTDNTDFKIGIRDPNSEADSYLGILSVSDISIVTSGDYERYFEKGGIKYHHILNPFTGYPENNDLRAVTIVCKSSLDADILSTSAFLLGFKNGKKLIESLDGIEAIFITKDNNIYITDGIKYKFELKNSEYKIIG